MKRIAAILLILLANTMLLAHMAIPHHHHAAGQPCFTGVEHQHSNECKHEADEHRKSDEACCALVDVVFAQPNSQKHHSGCTCELHTHHTNVYYLQATLPGFAWFIPSAFEGLPFRDKPLVENFYSVFVGRLYGLRAPPFVA